MNVIHQMQQIALALVGLVFLWAAIAKLASRADFKVTLWSIPHLPATLVPVIARVLPLVEIIVAVGLVLCLDIAKWMTIVLLLAFCALGLILLKAKLKVPCNCFGSSDRQFSVSTIAQNLGLIALICFGIPIKHAQEVSLNILAAAVLLVVGLSLVTVLKNRKTIVELQRLRII